MSRVFKILSIISAILSCIAILLSGAILTFLWDRLNIKFMNTPESIIAIGPIVPAGSIIRILGCFLISIILLITYKSKRTITVEGILFPLLCIIIPISSHYSDLVQNISIGQAAGDSSLVALSVTNTLMTLPLFLSSLSSHLCFLVSGMRIAEKSMIKKHRHIQSAGN